MPTTSSSSVAPKIALSCEIPVHGNQAEKKTTGPRHSHSKKKSPSKKPCGNHVNPRKKHRKRAMYWIPIKYHHWLSHFVAGAIELKIAIPI